MKAPFADNEAARNSSPSELAEATSARELKEAQAKATRYRKALEAIASGSAWSAVETAKFALEER